MNTNSISTVKNAYTDIPVAIMRKLGFSELPIETKKAFIEKMQHGINEAIKLAFLKHIGKKETLNDLENIFLANPEISEEELLEKIAQNPSFAELISEEINSFIRNMINL